eukprot:12808600-Ditylum_brightwellii.AAC.1
MHLFPYRSLAVAGLIAMACGVSPVSSAACPNIPTSLEISNCAKPQNWSDLNNIVASNSRVVLCPFTIILTNDERPLKLNQQHEIICANEGECVIEGGKTQLKILSASASVSIHGFTFKEATKSAVIVTAPNTLSKTQFLIYFASVSNDGARGSAIRGAKGTELFISQSSFVRNGAKLGTVFSEGKVEAVDSAFEDNFSTIIFRVCSFVLFNPNITARIRLTLSIQNQGSALYLKGGSNFTVRGTSFKNNTGGGNFISVAGERVIVT